MEIWMQEENIPVSWVGKQRYSKAKNSLKPIMFLPAQLVLLKYFWSTSEIWLLRLDTPQRGLWRLKWNIGRPYVPTLKMNSSGSCQTQVSLCHESALRHRMFPQLKMGWHLETRKAIPTSKSARGWISLIKNRQHFHGYKNSAYGTAYILIRVEAMDCLPYGEIQKSLMIQNNNIFACKEYILGTLTVSPKITSTLPVLCSNSDLLLAWKLGRCKFELMSEGYDTERYDTKIDLRCSTQHPHFEEVMS